jgi:hypothetical protein
MTQEIWKDIPEYEGYYQASSLGRIRSLDMVVKHWRGGKMKKLGRIMKQRKVTHPQREGFYLSVMLCVDQVKKIYSVHRLVALAFIPNPLKKEFINHKNGSKNDNRVENLEWVTCSENNQHAMDSKLRSAAKGERSAMAKLNTEKVLKIRALLSGGQTPKQISVRFNVSPSTIYYIKNRSTWAHI